MFSIHSLHLKRSRRLCVWIIAVTLAATLLVWVSDIRPIFQVGLTAFIMSVLIYNLLHHVGSRRIHTLRRQRDDLFELHSDTHRWHNMQLCAESKIAPYWVMLHFRCAQRFWVRKSVVILPDALPEHAFRRLRVYLKVLYPTDKLSR